MSTPRNTDVLLAVHHRTIQRNRLTMLTQKVTDDEIEDAIALLEWLTDPERRYLVDQLAGWSHRAQPVAQLSSLV